MRLNRGNRHVRRIMRQTGHKSIEVVLRYVRRAGCSQPTKPYTHELNLRVDFGKILARTATTLRRKYGRAG